jgi:dihydrofolate reductase
MFIEGEANWPELAPFHCPVYVLTHKKREPLERPGGTTFYFVNDDIHSVLDKAKKDAGSKDVRISGGADVILQYLYAGLVDELSLHVAPIIMGKGVRLFDNSGKPDEIKFSLEISNVVHSPIVTHLIYNVIKL